MRNFEPLDHGTATKWVEVPCDWRRGPSTPGATAYFDTKRGYGQVLPRPTDAELVSFYDLPEYYTHQSRVVSPRLSVVDRLMRKLAWARDHGIMATTEWWQEELGANPQTILEIGCGDGQNLSRLADLGHDVTGVEPDPKAMANARSRGLTVLPGNAERLPAELLQRQFDVILMMHVVEHFLDPQAAMTQARAILAHGGKLVIEVPNSECLGHAHFGPLWLWLDMPRHLNFFTARSVTQLVQAHGLRVVQLDYVGYTRAFMPDWREQQAQTAKAFGQPAPSLWRYWSYLFRTAMAAPAQRYDTLRIVAMAAD